MREKTWRKGEGEGKCNRQPKELWPKMVRVVEEWEIQKGGDKWFKGGDSVIR